MKHKITCNSSHSTIGSLRVAVNAWRKRECWSRETVVQMIVEAHVRIGADQASGIRFDGASDTFTRQHANAERVYRWLDDEAKDNNLLPTNFMRSIIAALPLDLRLMVVDELLIDTGLHAEVSAQGDMDTSPAQHLRKMLKEFSEAAAAVGDLSEHADDAAYLSRADKELAEIAGVIDAARASVHSRRRLHLQAAS